MAKSDPLRAKQFVTSYILVRREKVSGSTVYNSHDSNALPGRLGQAQLGPSQEDGGRRCTWACGIRFLVQLSRRFRQLPPIPSWLLVAFVTFMVSGIGILLYLVARLVCSRAVHKSAVGERPLSEPNVQLSPHSVL